MSRRKRHGIIVTNKEALLELRGRKEIDLQGA